jgi:hypothetical protein
MWFLAYRPPYFLFVYLIVVKYVSEKESFHSLSARDQRAFRYLFTLLPRRRVFSETRPAPVLQVYASGAKGSSLGITPNTCLPECQ